VGLRLPDVNRALLLCCALLVLTAGFGGKGTSDVRIDIVRITTPVTGVRSDPPLVAYTETFWLPCSPPTGTLPFGDRLCADIAAHPQAMLARSDPTPPATCTPYRPNSSYPGRFETVSTTVTITVSHLTTELDSPACGPADDESLGPLALQIYEAAAYGRGFSLDRLEVGLHCVEDPIAATFATLSFESQHACLEGEWTAANERLIRIAARAPVITALGRTELFTRDPGAQTCAIPFAGAVKTRTVHGQCSVSVLGDTVSFVEDWSGFDFFVPACRAGWETSITHGGVTYRRTTTAQHTWNVVVKNGRVASVTQHGQIPPATKPCATS
jgi:hypothetical protein